MASPAEPVCTPARRKDDTCGICLEALYASDGSPASPGGVVEAGVTSGIKVSLCGHAFHDECLGGWRTHSHNRGKVTLCPICRCRAGSSPSPVHAAYGPMRARTPGASMYSPYGGSVATIRPTRLASGDLVRITHARAAVQQRRLQQSRLDGQPPGGFNSLAFLQSMHGVERVPSGPEPIPELSQEDLAQSQDCPEAREVDAAPAVVMGVNFDASPVARPAPRLRLPPGAVAAPVFDESGLGAEYFATPAF